MKLPMRSPLMRRNSVLAVLLAALLAGCSTSRPATADKADIGKAVRNVVGTSLIGAKGATPADQDKIDDTVAGVCGARAWVPSECARHGQESREGAQ